MEGPKNDGPWKRWLLLNMTKFWVSMWHFRGCTIAWHLLSAWGTKCKKIILRAMRSGWLTLADSQWVCVVLKIPPFCTGYIFFPERKQASFLSVPCFFSFLFFFSGVLNMTNVEIQPLWCDFWSVFHIGSILSSTRMSCWCPDITTWANHTTTSKSPKDPGKPCVMCAIDSPSPFLLEIIFSFHL